MLRRFLSLQTEHVKMCSLACSSACLLVGKLVVSEQSHHYVNIYIGSEPMLPPFYYINDDCGEGYRQDLPPM